MRNLTNCARCSLPNQWRIRDDENKLSDLDLKKLGLKRDLEDMAEDLARQEWDFADKTEIELFEATLHNIQDKLDDEVAALRHWRATNHRRICRTISTPHRKIRSKRLIRRNRLPSSGALMEPGQHEDAEDSDKIPTWVSCQRSFH